jgi:hypothetical protein
MQIKRIFLFLLLNKKYYLLFIGLILAAISYNVYKKIGNTDIKYFNVSLLNLIYFWIQMSVCVL